MSINNDFKVACKCDDVERVKSLIKTCMINPTFCNHLGLVLACENGSIQVVKYLLKYTMCDPRAKDGLSLNKAVQNNHVKIVDLLLNDRRCDPIDGFLGLMCVSKIYYRDYRQLLQRFLCDPRILNWTRHCYAKLKCSHLLQTQLNHVYGYPINADRNFFAQRKAILKDKFWHIDLSQIDLPILLLVDIVADVCQPFSNLVDFHQLWLLIKASRQR